MPVTLLAAVALAARRATSRRRTPTGRLGDLRAVGTVQLKSSCGPEAQAGIERATALLHSFFYEEARRGFAEVAAKDAGLRAGALGRRHDATGTRSGRRPAPRSARPGAQAIERAQAGGKTRRRARPDRGARGLLRDPPASAAAPAAARAGQSCHGLTGGADARARALAYEKTMERLFAAHPRDVEVASFYALALLATHSPTDASLKNPTRAAADPRVLLRNEPQPPGRRCTT